MYRLPPFEINISYLLSGTDSSSCTQFYPIKTKSYIRLKTAANPEEIYGYPLLSTHSGADDVDRDWLMVTGNLANYNLIGSFSLEEDSRVTLP